MNNPNLPQQNLIPPPPSNYPPNSHSNYGRVITPRIISHIPRMSVFSHIPRRFPEVWNSMPPQYAMVAQKFLIDQQEKYRKAKNRTSNWVKK